MSDEVSLRYSNRKVFELVTGNTDIIEPVHPYQLQWMAHWTQATSSSSLQSHKHCAVTHAIKDRIGHFYLPVETMKPSYTCECKNGGRHDLGKQDPTSYMLQSVEARGGEAGRFRVMNNSVLRKYVNRSGSETLEKLSEHKLPASVINWENITSYNFQNSCSSTSKWTHFPMFDINRKLETIMAPKKQTSSNIMAAKMNEQLLPLGESPSAPHLIEFGSERHQHQQQNITQTDKEMRPYEFEEGFSHDNCHSSNMTSSMQNDEEYDLFCSGLAFKELFANANLSYSKHELCSYAKYSTIKVSEMKNDNLGCLRRSGIRLTDGSSYCPGHVPHQCLPEECSEERGNVCGRNKITLGLTKSNKMSNCSTIGRRKGQPEKLANATQYLLMTKEVGMDLSHKDQIAGGSTVSPNSQREEILRTLVSSTNNLEDVDGIGTQFMKKENESLINTDTMHIDVHGTPSSPEVGSSFKSQKIPQDVGHPNLKSSEMAVKDASRTESTDALSRKPSNPPTESTERDSETSWKWVKRLRPNPLDPIPLGTKRFKMGDTSSSGEMQNLLTGVVNYNRSISDLPECLQLDKTTFSPKSRECSPEESAKLIPWIQRWCRSSQETASPAPVLCEPESSKVLPEKLEAKQIPSLAAMALMGKQVTNFRPCEFQKSGSTIVWKI